LNLHLLPGFSRLPSYRLDYSLVDQSLAATTISPLITGPLFTHLF